MDELRQFRFGPFSAIDVAGTVIGANLLAGWLGWRPLPTIGAAFAAGVVVHRTFDVSTPAGQLLAGAAILPVIPP